MPVILNTWNISQIVHLETLDFYKYFNVFYVPYSKFLFWEVQEHIDCHGTKHFDIDKFLTENENFSLKEENGEKVLYHKPEVRVTFSNGKRVDTYYSSLEKAQKFHEGIANLIKPNWQNPGK